MANKIKVIITNDQNTVKVPSGVRLLIRRCCNAVLLMEEFDESAEISVRFVDNEQIRELNNEYRDIDKATDVLSFPLGENGVYDHNPSSGAALLGDIVISMQRAMEQAEEYGHSLDREVAFLTVHSMLHLLGYDHVNGGLEALRMREKEETVLTQLGLKRNGAYYLDEE
ncbi:MAG: rRNA maturation RNase YbeY [Clostridia bacterium]|nr:rRNA maturation RNase YbeY [Clostridia bacterium]